MSSLNRSAPLLFALLFVVAGCGDDEELGEVDEWDPDFVEVAEIVKNSCAQVLCHGQPSDDNTSLEFGGNINEVSLEQVQSVFEQYESADAIPLIEPGNAEDSLLYMVLVTDDQEMLMPAIRNPMPGVERRPLADEDIELIRGWINEGADY